MSEAKVIPITGAASARITAPVQQPATSAQPVGSIERTLAGLTAFIRRRIEGDYQVDEFGFDSDLSESIVAPVLRPLKNQWFSIECRGLDNIPSQGGALLVANHSGTLPLDGLMMSLTVHDEHPSHRFVRLLGADLVFSTPLIGPLARKMGNTLACAEDAERLLLAGELVGVYPEGFKGVGKGWAERYKLQRFGRGGFVVSAMRTGMPIIPVSIVGAEETYPMIADIKPLAKLLGFPYFPITPTFPLLGPLGLIPLPSRWIIEFGEPIDTSQYGAEGADDPMVVFNLTDQVREVIQQTLYSLLISRKSVFGRR